MQVGNTTKGATMPRVLPWVLSAGMIGVLAAGAHCQSRAAQDAFYTIDTPKVTLAPGAEGRVRIRFVAREGYHWNEEFPARLEVTEAPGLEVSKTRYTSASGDFRVESGVGVLEVPVQVAPGGPPSRVVRARADFSVCNDKECRIFKGVRLEVPVDVR